MSFRMLHGLFQKMLMLPAWGALVHVTLLLFSEELGQGELGAEPDRLHPGDSSVCVGGRGHGNG